MSRQDRFSWHSAQQRRARRRSLRRVLPNTRSLRLEQLEDRRVLAPVADITFSNSEIFEQETEFGFGDAISLDGVGDYVGLSAGEANFDAIQDAITIEAWFRVDTFDTPNQTILSKGNLWSIQRRGSTDFIEFTFANDFTLTSTINVNDGNWHHVRGTIDDEGYAFLELFVDGQSQDSLLLFNNGLPTNDFSARIGSNPQFAGRDFKGQIDEVRIWSVPDEQVPSPETLLSGTETGLVAYYNFDDGTANDLSVNSLDGVIQGDPAFVSSYSPSVIGVVDVTLSEVVTDSPGIIVHYSLSGMAIEGQDYYASQLDLSTTDLNPPTHSIFIPEGASGASIAIAALNDAVLEDVEDIVVTLQPDTDPFSNGPPARYTLGTNTVATINLKDAGNYSPGATLTNIFGENAVSQGLAVNAAGQATLSVRLTSEPTQNVTVNVGIGQGGVGPSSLLFTPANWFAAQEVAVSGLAAFITDDNVSDQITTLSLSFTSTESDFLFSRNVPIFDSFDNVKVKVKEGALPQTITPTVGIRKTTDAAEGASETGVFTVSSDVAAPAGGLRVYYTLADATDEGTEFNIIDASGGNAGYVDIPAGQYSAAILVEAIDDSIADGTLPVEIDLVADAAYNIDSSFDDAVVDVLDNDVASIETVKLTNIGKLDTTFEQSLIVDDFFNFDITSFKRVAGGAQATIRVSLVTLPSDNVVLTLDDANSAATGQLAFTPAGYNSPQSLTLNLVEANDLSLELTASTDANGDPLYSGLNMSLPFLRFASQFDVDTALTTSESGEDISFAVRLSSQPLGSVDVTLNSSDTSEGVLSTVLNFDSSNWNQYQVVTVVAQDDAFDDGNIAYTIAVDSSSVADANYDMLSADFGVVNEDDEITEDPTANVSDNATIIASISPIIHTASEGGDSAQFDIILSDPAPVGGLFVDYVIFEGSGTVQDIDAPAFVEQFGDNNPLAASLLDRSDGVFGATNLDFGDIDNDGDIDALLTLGGETSRLFENVGTPDFPQFVENFAVNPLLSTFGEGSSLGDVDSDGDLDIIQLDSSTTSLRYFESQLIQIGALSFIERTGVANPFDSLTFPNGFAPSLVDLDDDGDLELFVAGTASGLPSLDYFEVSGGIYVAAPNPLASAAFGFGSSFQFADWDQDGDQDAFLGGTSSIGYYENVGDSTSPSFVERVGIGNPTDGITGNSLRPALTDVDGNGKLDLFVADSFLVSEAETVVETGYFEAAVVQRAFIPEGDSSVTVSFVVVDDDIDEGSESLQVALVARQTESYDLRSTAVLDNTFDVVVTQAYDSFDGDVVLEIDPATVENIQGSTLEAGTVLTFTGGAIATVVANKYLDTVSGPQSVFVTLDPGGTQSIAVGERATATFDENVNILVINPFDGTNVGLRIGGLEIPDNLLLTAGTVLTFSNGTVASVDADTHINVFSVTPVPVSLISGTTIPDFNITQVQAPVGEVRLIVDDAETSLLGLSSGTRLEFSNGTIFEVTSPELLSSAIPADYNLDGMVNGDDLAVWQASYGQSGQGLPADGDNNHQVDGRDFLLWQRGFGVSDPTSTGVWVAGVLISGSTIPSGATVTIVEEGYRVAAALETTSALVGNSISLRINETAYSNFVLPAGTVLELSGGAKLVVSSDTLLNNSTGTAVTVELTDDTTVFSVASGEGTETSEFFTQVDFIVTAPPDPDGFIPVQITTSGVTSFFVPAGTIITFSSGAIVEVSFDTNITDIGGSIAGTIFPGSPVGTIQEILVGETSETRDLNAVSSATLVLQDNDTAGVSLVPSGLITSEAGASQTIDVMLTSQPKHDVIVYLGTDANEALLSDDDESDKSFVQLLFTSKNWNVAQQVTVTGVDDDVDDGDADYEVNVTVASADFEYTDDTVKVRLANTLELGSENGEFFVLDEIVIPDTLIPNQTIVTFTNGAKIKFFSDAFVQNSQANLASLAVDANVSKVDKNRTATVFDGDMRTIVDVISSYNAGIVELQLADPQVLSATLLAGKRLIFSNGAEAILDTDVTLNNSSGSVASVTLVKGTAIPDTETTFFEENLIVTTAYDAIDGDIGLLIDDSLIGAITLAGATTLEFSNGAVGTIGSQTAFSNTTKTITPIALDPNLITTQGSFFFTEELVTGLTFTNTDDDVAGVTVTQTDPTIAVTEGFANNFFTVVLNTRPNDKVRVTLSPSDANIALGSEFMGEPLTITFEPTNWDVPQTIEVSAVDDSVLEYDHISTIGFSITTSDTTDGYDNAPTPPDVKVFIEDDELPVATVKAVAEAIENNSPGYFVIQIDTPAPTGPGQTGIEVTYTVSGDVDTDGTGDTDDVLTMTGSVLIAPGETQSELIAFPIDDFIVEAFGYEGESLIVTLNPSSEYQLGTASSAAITIADNDIPGLRIVQTGDTTILSEGEAATEVYVSLLSQPTHDVTVNFSAVEATQTLEVEQSYNSSDTTVSLKLAGSSADSLLLPAGNYNFGSGSITLATDTTIFADKFTDVSVTVAGTIAANDTADYTYTEVEYGAGNATEQLVFTSSNWFILQSVPLLALDDAVVETGATHTRNIAIDLVSSDTIYDTLVVEDLPVDIVDRQFDIEETYLSLSQGFLALQDSIENVTLPIIGDFGEVAPSFIDKFLSEFVEQIRETDNLTAQTLADAFGAALTAAIDIDVFTFEVTSISSDELSFLITIGDSLMEEVNLTGDLGLEALNIGIESEGAIELNVEYALSLGFGINTSDGFYLDTTTTGFDVAASIALSEGFTATGQLGFIEIDVANAIDPVTVIAVSEFADTDPEIELLIDDPSIDSYILEAGSIIEFAGGTQVIVDADTEIFNGVATLVAVTSATGSVAMDETGVGGDVDGTAVNASFTVTLQDANDTNGNTDQLTLSELVSARKGSPFDFLSYSFAGDATLDLDVTTSVSGTASFPSFSFNLFSNLPLFNYSNEAEADSMGGQFDIEFNDITLDLGGFITDLVKPVISSINAVLEPFQPVIDVLNSELKLFSTIGLADAFDQDGNGEATLIEVALTLAGGITNGNTAAKFTKFVDAVSGVIELTELLAELDAADTLAINFGSYTLEDFRGGSEIADAAEVDAEAGGTSVAPPTDPEEQAMSTGDNKVTGLFSKLEDLGITLDIVENPLNVIKLFLGQDIDLITWDAPELDLNFEIQRSFPVFLGINGEIKGEFSIYSDLVFGFDTYGFSQWKDRDFALQYSYLVFDGFYVSDVDPETGEDVDELTLEATISVGVEANAVVSQISASGGITGTATLDFIDSGEYSGEADGRIRGSELLAGISRPLRLFEIAGAIEAFVEVTVSVGIDLGFWEITKVVYERELARVTLFEFQVGGGGGGGSPLTATIVAEPEFQESTPIVTSQPILSIATTSSSTLPPYQNVQSVSAYPTALLTEQPEAIESQSVLSTEFANELERASASFAAAPFDRFFFITPSGPASQETGRDTNYRREALEAILGGLVWRDPQAHRFDQPSRHEESLVDEIFAALIIFEDLEEQEENEVPPELLDLVLAEL